jgi:hypothetical protein
MVMSKGTNDEYPLTRDFMYEPDLVSSSLRPPAESRAQVPSAVLSPLPS